MTAATDIQDATLPARVWDLPTRLFHWLLVFGVVAALATQFLAPIWWLSWHVAAGYLIAALLMFRLIWAIFGSEYSRVASFFHRPRHIAGYLHGLLKLRPPFYVGHNPAGAVMIFVLFAVLMGLVGTGFVVLGGHEKQGPLAGVTSFAFGGDARTVHSVLAYLLIALVAAHLLGVLVDGRLHKASPVRAMITGWKRVPARLAILPVRPARIRAALVAATATSVPAIVTLVLLSHLPALGVPAMVPDPVWVSECGGCHYAFHPSLLPRASWSAIMAGLPDHFGEDASLPPTAAAEVGAFLLANSAENWDTRAARLLSTVSPAEPLRVTAAPFWVRRHGRIDPALFAIPAVKAKSNCIACHRDADTGRFDAQAIVVPPLVTPGDLS